MDLQLNDRQLKDNIEKLITCFGFDGMCFSIRPVASENPLPDLKKLSKPFNSYAERQKVFVSLDERSKSIRKDYYRTISKIDLQSRGFSIGFNLWRGVDKASKNAQRVEQFKQKHGLTCVVNYRTELVGFNGWHGAFNLFSSKPESEVEALLAEGEEQLDWQLQLYSSHLCQLYMAQLNPIVNFDCLSDKSLNIVGLMAEDYNNAEIANALHLSERGVSYHVDRLKQIFDVSSRAALMSKVYQFGLLARD